MDATEIGMCIGDKLMRKLSSEAEKIMIERFGKDTVIALATVEQEMPYVRNVNAYYEDGSFYIITYALSNKIKQIEKNPNVAIASDWFTARSEEHTSELQSRFDLVC